MNVLLVRTGFAAVVIGLVAIGVIEFGPLASAQAALRACYDLRLAGSDQDCEGLHEEIFNLQLRFQFPAAAGAGVGALLVLLGIGSDTPPPAWVRKRIEPPVTWRWRALHVGPEIRIPLFLGPILVVSLVSWNPAFVLASLLAFGVPIALWRKSLSPTLIRRSFIVGLAVAVYLVALSVAGVVGLLCVSAIALVALLVLFLLAGSY